jgi:Magnesium chelatase, subunit ChlI
MNLAPADVSRPGEVSRGHNGVRFLDELPEFQRNVLEVMRRRSKTARSPILTPWKTSSPAI